jgi:hypothetical protein
VTSRSARATTARRLVLLGVLVGMLAGCSAVSSRLAPSTGAEPPQRYPRNAFRFELRALSDSTVAFTPAEATWVRSGMVGIAVDPAQGDALVARLRIMSVYGDSAVAVVTGQTTRVSAGQVILLVPPKTVWWRQRAFWYGAASGAVAVASVALLLL